MAIKRSTATLLLPTQHPREKAASGAMCTNGRHDADPCKNPLEESRASSSLKG